MSHHGFCNQAKRRWLVARAGKPHDTREVVGTAKPAGIQRADDFVTLWPQGDAPPAAGAVA